VAEQGELMRLGEKILYKCVNYDMDINAFSFYLLLLFISVVIIAWYALIGHTICENPDGNHYSYHHGRDYFARP
jgi:hypothetical protein